MKKIGFIVSDYKVSNIPEYIGLVNDISLVDKDLPFMIIGLSNAKKIIGEKFSILEKRVSDKIFWTFLKTEKRSDYEDDLNKFYFFCLNNIINNIKYYYINIINIKYNKLKILYNIITNNNILKYIFINNKMIYIYHNNYILGLSLDVMDFCKIDKNKIFRIIKSNRSNIVKENEFFLSQEIRRIIGDRKYIMPYFLSLKENETA